MKPLLKWIIVAVMAVLLAGAITGIVILIIGKDPETSDSETTAEPTTRQTTEETTEPNNLTVYSFPSNFKIGAASASYQIEGGWNEDGKSPNIWDTITHDNPDFIDDKSTGDVATDSYHMMDKDIEALKNTGVSGRAVINSI